ncbi:MAG: GTPase [Actinomycetota bacterium]
MTTPLRVDDPPQLSLLTDTSHLPCIDAEDITARAAALTQALEVGGARLPDNVVRRVEAVLERIDGRLQLSVGHTVVALAGATGSGKSSLFNTIAGLDLTAVGVRRPTTSQATSCVWGSIDAEPLLDWLEIPTRHRTQRDSPLDNPGDSKGDALAGLVLLDLPDYDSTEEEHRRIVNRLLNFVDVFIWVTDPQKYADMTLHTQYLAPMARHQGTTVVVLNQADRLTADQVEVCRADLERLVRADGLTQASVTATSTVDGRGIGQLRDRLVTAVHQRTAATRRLAVDLTVCAEEVQDSLTAVHSPGAASVFTSANFASLTVPSSLVTALADAVGVPLIAQAVEDATVTAAIRATEWPVARGWRRVRQWKPLRRARTRDAVDQEPIVVVAEPSQAQQDRIDMTIRSWLREVVTGMPSRWVDSIDEVIAPAREQVVRAMREEIAGARVPVVSPGWWARLRRLHAVCLGIAAAGLAWSSLIGVWGMPQFVSLPDSRWGPVPISVFLVIAGCGSGVFFAQVAQVVAQRSALRLSAQVRQQWEATITDVFNEYLVEPIARILTEYQRARKAAVTATGGRTGAEQS